MTATVLDYPVRFEDCETEEPTLEELILAYYLRHLPENEAMTMAKKYYEEIKYAEGLTKMAFAKFVILNLDWPKGTDVAALLNGSADKILAKILRNRTENPKQAPAPKESVVKVFHSFEELMDYFDEKH